MLPFTYSMCTLLGFAAFIKNANAGWWLLIAAQISLLLHSVLTQEYGFIPLGLLVGYVSTIGAVRKWRPRD